MNATMSALQNAFMEDHRHLTRGFTDLREALRINDPGEAHRIAELLDRRGGPHIEFEETVFYPELIRVLGKDNVMQLYHEHETGLDAIRAVLQRDQRRPFSESELTALGAAVDVALEHVISCGTLLSHVRDLGRDRQAEMLRQLKSIRTEGRRWTQLPHSVG